MLWFGFMASLAPRVALYGSLVYGLDAYLDWGLDGDFSDSFDGEAFPRDGLLSSEGVFLPRIFDGTTALSLI